MEELKIYLKPLFIIICLIIMTLIMYIMTDNSILESLIFAIILYIILLMAEFISHKKKTKI